MINIQALYNLIGIVLILLTISCSDKNKIASVQISFPGDNVSNAQIEIHTTDLQNVFIKYRIDGQNEKPSLSQISKNNKTHKILLANLQPGQQYTFNIFTTHTKLSRDYFFKTIDSTGGIKDSLKIVCADTTLLPAVFREGHVMIHRREVPGIILLLNPKGNVVWHHEAKDAGFKVVHYTRNKTFLCLLGVKEYETSYGSTILELSLKGDTLLYLKKGVNDFQQTIHHEIILNPKNQIVTLCVEDKIFDLRSKGGSIKDTVRGDGILILDRQGRKIWKWTVFDEMDPLMDDNIVKNKRDWMHANSVSFDKDGNYLISFYNNGQIWKIDSKTGTVRWKLGKGGDIEMPAGLAFGQAHAVHVNDRGWIMFFDNGTNNRLSRTLALALDESTKKAQLVIDTWLPPQLFTERMGSSYLVGDTSLLQCASKHKTVALTDFNGNFLWQLKSNNIMSYRAEFISKEKLDPILN